MTYRIVDLFAGPGGWDEGLRLLGRTDVVGVEHDRDACLTGHAAGHARLRADVAIYPPSAFTGVEGLIASPPCTAFSVAGKGEGRELVPLLLDAIRDGDWTALRDDYDPTVWLPLEVGRWVEETGPVWVACEQVPPALPLWEAYVRRLKEQGWSAWCGVLNAADYGVPQTRKRAFLLATRDGEAVPPLPTHAKGGGSTLFGQLAPWVSMAQALGWDGALALQSSNRPGDARRAGENRRTRTPIGEPATTIDTVGSQRWVVLTGTNSMKHSRDPDDMVPYERSTGAPAPTLDAKVGGAWKVAADGEHEDPPHRWKQRRDSGPAAEREPRSADEPSYTIRASGSGSAPSGVEWIHDRPSTTVVGSFRPDIIASPGYRTDVSRQDAPDSVRVTVEQAAVLQSFRPDYPWHGSKTSKFRSVGNAVPPLLAAHVLAAVGAGTLELEARR